MSDHDDPIARTLQAQHTRRELLKSGALAAGAMAMGGTPAFAQSAGAFTDWGWPKPYTQVSTKSKDWLKSKGWWPLKIAWNPHWSDGNLVVYVMNKYKLME